MLDAHPSRGEVCKAVSVVDGGWSAQPNTSNGGSSLNPQVTFSAFSCFLLSVSAFFLIVILLTLLRKKNDLTLNLSLAAIPLCSFLL